MKSKQITMQDQSNKNMVINSYCAEVLNPPPPPFLLTTPYVVNPLYGYIFLNIFSRPPAFDNIYLEILSN